MAPKCYICNHYVSKNVSLFRIPDRNDEYSERCGLWLKLLNENSQNMHNIRVCGEHFLKRKPAKSGEYLDIDWVPNKNLGRFAQNWKRIEYYFRKKGSNQQVQNLHSTQINDNYLVEINDLSTKNKMSNDNPIKNDLNSDSNLTQKESNINNDIICSSTSNPFVTPKKIVNAITKSSDNPIINTSNSKNSDVDSASNDIPIFSSKKNKMSNDDPMKNNLNSESDLTQKVTNINNDIMCGSTSNPFVTSKRIVNAIIKSSDNSIVKNSDVDRALNDITIFSSTNKQLCQAVSVKTTGKDALNTVLVPVKKRKIYDIEQKLFFPKDIQTDLSSTDIDLLFQYYQQTVEERNKLLLRISTLVIDVDFLKGNDKKTLFYTGLPTWSLLNNFFAMIKDFLPTHPNFKLSGFQMVVLTLMKLRLNLSFTDLGYRFQVDETTASRYFHRCLYILFKLFNESKLLHWPTRQNLLQNIPSYFRSIFKEQITIIIDCFEIFTERSSLLRAAAQGFSQYKHHATLKFLIGITTTGVIIFISPAFGGRASDKAIILQSKFLDKLQENDVVLADKGFLIEKEVEEKDATLKIPSFVRNVNQLHPSDVEETRNIARIRIHVERVICQLREKFNICSDIAQMSAISKQNYLFDRDVYDKILFVCSCLVNICPTVVPNDFEM